MELKFCGRCGTKLVNGASFCGGCGAPIPKFTPDSDSAPASNNEYRSNMMSGSEHDQNRDLSGRLRQSFDSYFNQEGTGLLVNQRVTASGSVNGNANVKRGELFLNSEEKKRGSVKVLDFGTGQRFSINIPPGMNAGDSIIVRGTGLKDPVFGTDCEIELTVF